jgi:fido (protein-threonine AMPylation protein)
MLVREIHRRWFETTFPADAGRERTSMVVNRKGTASAVDAILPGVIGACENWTWRRANVAPDGEEELVEFVVVEANTLAVTVYDVHPFIDGNTRTTWHLRNYVLMLDGLRPLLDPGNEDEYMAAWWEATPHEHEALDQIVLQELARQERSDA